ncbi:CmcJ/NvfI family oxidoreductase [uncultured Marinobacter sp.]|uniref:CmcJ/NvfI family oxidoreductase n=1 Tax=uncultured Marinobacter sp. TaxID=187379 RepID=UPI0026089DA7|nr:CmcJ/NvfI family oxidoreductase [uncultured Marinobacter sp.]
MTKWTETTPIQAGTVTGEITFMVPTEQRPYVHTEALTGETEPHYHAELQRREVSIHDARAQAPELSLDRHGIELRQRPSAVKDFYDNTSVEQEYYPEIEALVREATGASRVLIFDHTRRRDDGSGNAKTPADRAHNDYTEWSAPERVRDLLGEEEARHLRDVPFVQVNAWRPIRGPVRRSPLAVLDAATIDPEDLIATDMVYPERTGEIYHLAFNPGQRWLYFPAMQRDEVLLIKGYDSRTDGRARFVPHTAFQDPGTPADEPPRESIEVRTLAFFE